mgnify:FL=1
MRKAFLEGRTKTSIANEYGCGLTTVHRATSDLKSSQQHLRKYKVEQGFFSEVNKHKAYMLGVLWADGNLYERTHTVSLSAHKNDIEEVEWFASKLGVSHEAIKPHSYNCVQFRFTGKKLYQDLLEVGFDERKSTEGAKKFNKEFLGPFLWDFVRGLIDGDGCVHFNERTGKRCVFVTGNQPTIFQLKEIFDSVGIVSYVSENPGCWRITVSKQESLKKLFDLLYHQVKKENDGYYERKHRKFVGIYGYNPRRGRPNKKEVRSVEIV